MKDFYKILGLKDDASEEEIRERWIELTKQYHPDRTEDSSSDGKIREINEAYQVLKHSSTRVEYDLMRTYGKEERKRRVRFKRWGVAASILIILIVVGVISIIHHTASTPPASLVSNGSKAGSTHSRLLTSTNQKDQKNQKDQINQISTHQRVDPSPRSSVTASHSVNDSMTQLPNDSRRPAAHSRIVTSTDRSDQRDQINQTDQKNQIDQKDQINIQLGQFAPPSLLATEEEVKRFFVHYNSCYNRMDLNGIYSLFSSKAAQNQMIGLEEIRKNYSDFFRESKEIRYSLQDMKIEIYQNVVEVKARYEIEQIVKETGEKEVWRGPVRWVLVKEDGKLRIRSVDYKYQRPSLGRKEEFNEASQNNFYFHVSYNDLPPFCEGPGSPVARDSKSRDHGGCSSIH